MAGELRVGELLLGKDDLTKTVTTKRGVFILRMLDPMGRKALIRNISTAIGHAPLESIPAGDYLYTKAVETLKLAVQEGPDWWEGAERCMDDELLMELYEAYLAFEEAFRRRVRGSRPAGRGKGDKPAGQVDNRHVPGSPD